MSTYFGVIVSVIFLSYLAQRCSYWKISEFDNQIVFVKKNDAKVCLFLIGAILVITAGCRYHVGTDYGAYISLYESYIKTSLKELFTLDEPILPIIGNLCGKYFDSYKAMFFIASLITVGLAVYSMLDEADDFMFVILIYIFVGCWHGSFNGIRQYMAVTILFLGRKHIFNRELLKYALYCFVAFLCHKSAAVFLLLYFMYSKTFSIKRLIIIIISVIIISRNYEIVFSMIGWVNESEFVVTEYASRTVSIFRIAVGCAPAIFALYYAFTRKLDKMQVFYTYMLVANAAVRLSTSGSAYLARLGAYTGIFVPLGLASILRSTERKYKNVLRLFILIMYAIYWIYEINNSETLSVFEWFWNK